MKKRESNEPDLYVVNRNLTKKESKEMSEFIEEYKRKKALSKKTKHKKAV
jgi:hypothetical protein